MGLLLIFITQMVSPGFNMDEDMLLDQINKTKFLKKEFEIFSYFSKFLKTGIREGKDLVSKQSGFQKFARLPDRM